MINNTIFMFPTSKIQFKKINVSSDENKNISTNVFLRYNLVHSLLAEREREFNSIYWLISISKLPTPSQKCLLGA